MKNRQQGFSLLEVLIALVILTIAFGAVMMSINENTRTLLYLERKTAAGWVAADVMTTTQLNINTSSAGREEIFDNVWYWTIDIEDTENKAVQKITVNVSQTETSPSVFTLIGFKETPSA